MNLNEERFRNPNARRDLNNLLLYTFNECFGESNLLSAKIIEDGIEVTTNRVLIEGRPSVNVMYSLVDQLLKVEYVNVEFTHVFNHEPNLVIRVNEVLFDYDENTEDVTALCSKATPEELEGRNVHIALSGVLAHYGKLTRIRNGWIVGVHEPAKGHNYEAMRFRPRIYRDKQNTVNTGYVIRGSESCGMLRIGNLYAKALQSELKFRDSGKPFSEDGPRFKTDWTAFLMTALLSDIEVLNLMSMAVSEGLIK